MWGREWVNCLGLGWEGWRKELGWVLKIAIHLEQFTKPSGTPKEIPEGLIEEMWPRVPSVPTLCVAPGSAVQDAVLPDVGREVKWD